MLTMTLNKVAIAPIFDPDKIGSIHIPDQAKERCDQGIVKYVSGDCEYLQVGDHVLFSGYSGTLIQLEDEGLLIIMPEDFITAIIYDDPIDIPGLYFKAQDGTYFTATHEMATHIITQAMSGHTSVRHSARSKIDNRPKVEDYNRLR